MARMPVEVRLFYIGLWNLADDAGFLEWNLPEIAAALSPYESAPDREKVARSGARLLVKAGRVEVLSCKTHARIATIERWKIPGGGQFYGVQKAHSKCQSGSIRINPDQSVSHSHSHSGSHSQSLPTREGEDLISKEAETEWKKVGESLGSRRHN